jgi:hypothetical protein
LLISSVYPAFSTSRETLIVYLAFLTRTHESERLFFNRASLGKEINRTGIIILPIPSPAFI